MVYSIISPYYNIPVMGIWWNIMIWWNHVGSMGVSVMKTPQNSSMGIQLRPRIRPQIRPGTSKDPELNQGYGWRVVFDGKGIYSPGSRKACCEARWSQYHPSLPPKKCYDYVWLRVHSEPMIVVILQYLHCPEHVFSTRESNSCYNRESTKAYIK